jgi:HSP20 family protein
MAFKDYRDLIRQMEREMQQIHDEAFRGFFTLPVGGSSRFWQPSVDIHETEDGLLVKMELAGTRADDLQVSLSPDDRVLTISGTRGEAAAAREGRIGCHQLEIYFGPFERSLALPAGVPLDRDRITAVYRDGFLLVTLPKRSPREPQTRLIPINVGEAVTSGENEDNK